MIGVSVIAVVRRDQRGGRHHRQIRGFRALRGSRAARLLELRGGVFCLYYTDPNFVHRGFAMISRSIRYQVMFREWSKMPSNEAWFDSIGHVRASTVRGYFSEHMAKQDYLTESGQAELTWEGTGAIRLGLAGHVQEDHFARLCAGRDPSTDARLTPRDNGPNRRVCYFGQISAPKDVSIAYLVGGDQRIAAWWTAGNGNI
jgi:hypothetical protein